MPSDDAEPEFGFAAKVAACQLCQLPFGLCQFKFMSCYGELELPELPGSTLLGIAND